MATKKTNIEELRRQCHDAEILFKDLHAQLTKAEKEEEEARQAKLEAEKQQRYNDVIDAYRKFTELKDAYVNDYGYFYSKYALWF